MRYGVFLPIFDQLADPAVLAELAVSAEEAGWDGVFFWDHIYYRPPVEAVTDPWAAMTLAAYRTDRILIGPMVTPLARRRPQVLARQAVAVDRLSSGRFVMGVGLGLDGSGAELSRFGEELDDRRRARMLDESLEVLSAMWSGQEMDHRGENFTARGRFLPAPSAGRIPVWVAGRWPRRRPIRRAAAHDGLFLIDVERPEDVSSALGLLADYRGAAPTADFELVVTRPPRSDPEPWAAAGATWWLTWFEPFDTQLADVSAVVAAGPPASAAG